MNQHPAPDTDIPFTLYWVYHCFAVNISIKNEKKMMCKKQTLLLVILYSLACTMYMYIIMSDEFIDQGNVQWFLQDIEHWKQKTNQSDSIENLCLAILFITKYLLNISLWWWTRSWVMTKTVITRMLQVAQVYSTFSTLL